MSIDNLFSLSGKTAVVTGGRGHLGSAICRCLAQAGANIVVASRNSKQCKALAKELSREYRVNAIGIKLDISSRKSIDKCMNEAKTAMGSIDILVNNAYFGATGDIRNISEENWSKGIDGTINSVFRCTQAVIPYMESQGHGVIMNVASMYGVVSPNPKIYGDSGLDNPPNYGAGKAAIIQFTKYSACYLADKNIRVNSITPGAFPNKKVQKNKKFISNLKKNIPLGRVGRPEDLQGAVLFLASDASSYVTGANIIVDGGWTAW